MAPRMKAEAVLYVRHLHEMQLFYERCFGLEATEANAGYAVLESDAWTLSLVESRRRGAVPEEPAATARREETPIKLAFGVASIEGLRPAITDLGGYLDSAETAWSFRGLTRCDCVDPEGNVVQLLEGAGPELPGPR